VGSVLDGSASPKVNIATIERAPELYFEDARCAPPGQATIRKRRGLLEGKL
jgi:hypothetical protein